MQSLESTLVTNSPTSNVLASLLASLDKCQEFYFTVAFLTFGGAQLLVQKFKELEQKGVKGKIITATYQNFSDPKAIKKLQSFSNIEVRLYDSAEHNDLHAKGYLFMDGQMVEVYIGSSNITSNALKKNIEWNVKITKGFQEEFTQTILNDFDTLWAQAGELTVEKLARYEEQYRRFEQFKKDNVIELEDVVSEITPNIMQLEAMTRLNSLREHHQNKALVIAATGTGKTYMSAFDVKQCEPKRLLFIVHREEILRKAKQTFEQVLPHKKDVMGLLTGTSKETNSNYLFATIQSISRIFTQYDKSYFDYIVIDEAHHVGGETYQKVLDYFTPSFLLGMTATPERCDDYSIFDRFDGHVALEVRLREALAEELIIPFHYFGIRDIEGIDLSDIKSNDIQEITKRLKVNERVEFIIEQMNLFDYDGEYRKALGFCMTIEHAEYMTQKFNEQGIKSMCLTGNNTADERADVIRRLEDDTDKLEVIFTVDIFNEGVDIPCVNQVLMLRPTQSPIIFIQQLGRGLRKSDNKSFLTVLDFIGNHQKSFLTATALSGGRFYDKDGLKVAVDSGFQDIPGDSFIILDSISKEQILAQLDKENFNSMAYLKETYQEFKRMMSGRVPYYLTDYLKYEGAPDPIKFIKKEKSYLHFFSKVEKKDAVSFLLTHEVFSSLLKEWSNQLPLKRVYEFVIIKYFLDYPHVFDISVSTARAEISKYVDSVADESVRHALQCLGFMYSDSSDKKFYVQVFEYIGDTLIVTQKFNEMRLAPHFKTYLDDVVTYGLVRYQEVFKSIDYGVPHFKLYECYTMREVARLCNYNKIHSAFRGSGLLVFKNDYFLFIDLHKEEDVKESINYLDKFISPRQFQWQSPNATKQSSQRGQELVNNVGHNINLHLFVRKFKEVDKQAQPYIYIGCGNTIEASGDKPITLQLELVNEVPHQLYMEFVHKV